MFWQHVLCSLYCICCWFSICFWGTQLELKITTVCLFAPTSEFIIKVLSNSDEKEKRKHLVCSFSLIILCFVSCFLSSSTDKNKNKRGFYHKKKKMWWNAWVNKQDIGSMMMSDMNETTWASATDVMRLQSCLKSSSRITCRESEWFL